MQLIIFTRLLKFLLIKNVLYLMSAGTVVDNKQFSGTGAVNVFYTH